MPGYTTPPGPRIDANRSMRHASVIAGIGLLLMSVLSAVGYLVGVKRLVTQGNPARTAKDILGSVGLFRFGILSLYLVAALDVVVAWALYHVFRPVSEGVSMLAAWLRVVYAGVFVVAISQLVGVLHLLGNAGYLAVFSTNQLHAQALLRINTFTDISVSSSSASTCSSLPVSLSGRATSPGSSASCSPSLVLAICSTVSAVYFPEAPGLISPRSPVSASFWSLSGS